MDEGQPITVLHVDDDPDVAETAASLLERELEDGEVVTAHGPKAGLAVLEERDVDCVVSDYDMPESDGIAFLEQVRERDGDLPFVLFTGKGSEEIASRAISAGVTDYLQKSMEPEQFTVLAHRITKAVERYRSQRRLAETERKLSELAEKADDVLFMFTGDWSELLFVNSAYEAIWGAPVEELERDATSFVEHVHPDDRDLVRRRMAEISSGEEAVAEFRVERAEDDVRWVRAYSKPIRGGDDGEGETEVTRIVGYVRDVTPLRERERALEETSEQLEAVIEASPDAIMVVDEDARITMWNPAAEELFGWSEDEVLGEQNPIIPDEKREEFEEHKERAFAGESLSAVETQRLTKDGSLVDVSLSTASISDAEGETIGAMAVIEDIGERKERERQLERYERIVDNLPVAVYRTDVSGEILDANPEAAAIIGADGPEDVVGRNVLELYADPAGRETISEMLAEEGEVAGVEVEAETLDGDTLWLEIISAAVEEDDEIYFDGIARDVTERKQREREIERTRDLLSQAQEAAQVAGWIFDFTEDPPREPEWTDKMYDIMDLDPDEEPPTLHELLDRYHPDDRERRDEIVDDALERGEGWEVEARIVTFDDEVKWVRSIGDPVWEDGELVRVRGSFQDITDRKEREREIERQNQRLQEFAEVVSHDLRNPLTVAQGRLELVRDEHDGEHVEAVAEAHDRIKEIIENLLALATEGDDAVDREPVPLDAVAETAWNQVATRGAELETAVETRVEADRDQLQRLFENLYRNAVVHGGDDVAVRVEETDDGFAVADDGAGFPDDAVDDVLAPGETTSDEGTGFGLAIVDRIAENHGWSLALGESADGGARVAVEDVDRA